jgi:transcriptional regulator with XRE-family HTH domain
MNLRQRLQISLKDEEYRNAYADEQLNLHIGTQIKVVREQQGMTQSELAQKLGTKQAGISRLESANYDGWTIGILRKLAKAFDLRLCVSFEEFGSLWKEVEEFRRETLQRRKFSADPEFSKALNPAFAQQPTRLYSVAGNETSLRLPAYGHINSLNPERASYAYHG